MFRLAARTLIVSTVLAIALTVTTETPAVASDWQLVAMTAGVGRFTYAGTTPVDFAFFGATRTNGSATGAFYHRFVLDGLSYEYAGTVTCLAFDAPNHRAWVGGVLTFVRTNDPAISRKPGDDAWFRVVDNGHDPSRPDRSTLMGFKGVIPTSAEYCAQRPWPAGDARTWPVTRGDILVR